MKDLKENRTVTHQEKTIEFIFMMFTIGVMIISAVTSFGFFYTYFGNLLPAGLVDSNISQAVSGIIGTSLFSIATAIWLLAFLYHAQTPEQRAVSLAMTIVAFLGDSFSSVAYLVLNATGEMMVVSDQTREVVAMVSLVVVIFGIIANFGASQMYNRFSERSKQAVREADRRDRMSVILDQKRADLDSKVAAQVDVELEALIPQLAKGQAGKLADEFRNVEQLRAKRDPKRMGSDDSSPLTGQPINNLGTNTPTAGQLVIESDTGRRVIHPTPSPATESNRIPK